MAKGVLASATRHILVSEDCFVSQNEADSFLQDGSPNNMLLDLTGYSLLT